MVKLHTTAPRRHLTHCGRQQGVTYLWMLFFICILTLGLGKTLDIYLITAQREREADLLVVGKLYRDAIQHYYLSSPGSVHKYPQKLDELLRDPRHLVRRRYLRSLYADPMTGRAFEPVFSPEGGIWGVQSTSTKQPIKVSGFQKADAAFANAPNYQHWKFIANEVK